jgi:hypothetical protein
MKKLLPDPCPEDAPEKREPADDAAPLSGVPESEAVWYLVSAASKDISTKTIRIYDPSITIFHLLIISKRIAIRKEVNLRSNEIGRFSEECSRGFI